MILSFLPPQFGQCCDPQAGAGDRPVWATFTAHGVTLLRDDLAPKKDAAAPAAKSR